MALIINKAMCMLMPVMNSSEPTKSSRGPFERILVDAFRRAGWSVSRQDIGDSRGLDLIARRGDQIYVVQAKTAPEARRDRMIPLLAEAILRVQAIARTSDKLKPLAVVASGRVPFRLADEIRKFATKYAPGVSVGIIDLEGLREFIGPQLDELNARPERPRTSPPRRTSGLAFSDLNQWMLKLLLAPMLPADMMRAPRRIYRNATELAEAGSVSVMTAFRLLDQLSAAGFLGKSENGLRLVRVAELLERWQAASSLGQHDIPMRWIIRKDGADQLMKTLRSYESSTSMNAKGRVRQGNRPTRARACLGLFAAAQVLGVGAVHGVPPYLYLENTDEKVLRDLGLSQDVSLQRIDVYARVPAAHESVFRAAVDLNGVHVSDIIQIWLDVSSHPTRGKFQAERIRHRILAPLFEGKQ